MPKKTLYPISFDELQAYLNHCGYNLTVHDPVKKVIHWELDESRSRFENAPVLLTTLRPDFIADGIGQPVYDKNYVLDVLHLIAGQNDCDDGLELMAFVHNKERIH